MHATSFFSQRLAAGSALLIVGLILSACQFGGASAPVEEVTLGGEDTTTPAAAATTPAATVAGRAVTPTPAAEFVTETEGTAAAGSANVTISPNQVAMGNVVLTLAVEPAQPAFESARATSNPSPGDEPNANAPPKGYAVLAGAGLKITNNFDASQNPPADSEREVLRHVALQIRDKESQQLIPHVNVSMDLLRDGRPVLQDQPLAPMVPVGGDVTKLQYGNNVKFPGRGEYQVFVRMEPSPLLGPGASGVAQFNVSIK